MGTALLLALLSLSLVGTRWASRGQGILHYMPSTQRPGASGGGSGGGGGEGKDGIGGWGKAQELALSWAHLQNRCPRLCPDLRLRALGGTRESVSRSHGNTITECPWFTNL